MARSESGPNIVVSEVEMSPCVIGLIAAKAAQISEKVTQRGWGRELLSHGVTHGNDVYAAGDCYRPGPDGEQVQCVSLTVTRNAFKSEAERFIDTYYFPVDRLVEINAFLHVLSD